MGILNVRSTMERPKAGFLCALSLLVLVTVLAGSLGWTRRSVPHGDRIAPEGWTISFTVPRFWTASAFGSKTGRTFAFVEPDHGGRNRVLLVHRRANTQHASPDVIARACLLDWAYQGLGDLSFLRGVRAVSGPFGPLAGAQITDGQVFVAAGVHESNGYCVGLICNESLTQTDLELAERVVDSTKIEQ